MLNTGVRRSFTCSLYRNTRGSPMISCVCIPFTRYVDNTSIFSLLSRRYLRWSFLYRRVLARMNLVTGGRVLNTGVRRTFTCSLYCNTRGPNIFTRAQVNFSKKMHCICKVQNLLILLLGARSFS